MYKKILHWTEEIVVFTPGERITPTSNRSSLKIGEVYTVASYLEPRVPGDVPVIFVEGRETGIPAEYVRSIDPPKRKNIS